MSDYQIGKGKPPKHTRYRPGQSGNPSGRRKGSQNLKTALRKILMMPVRIKQTGRVKKVSTQQAVLLALRNNALKNDRWAVQHLLELADRHNNEAPETLSHRDMPSGDRAILDRYEAEVVARALAKAKRPPAEMEKRVKRRRLEDNE
jgi:hypothetical protein